jgi:ribonuclease D
MTAEYPKFISKEDINALPMLDYQGEIILIETAQGAKRAVAELVHEPVLGFDTETRPSFVKGQSYKIALLQLATLERAYLFRLNRFPITEELVHLLSNPDVIKAGVGILDDLRGLQKIADFKPQGFVDLSKVVEKNGFTSLGLRALTAIFLGQRLSKAAKVTNWERRDLTEAQLKYAAADALVGLQIYHKIKHLV